jgi:catechol 2,3-dioxygenase-like lactoylglutathione lyase family enzyme
MISGAKYVHTNLIARDWRALSQFYQDLFGCTPLLPERNLSGPALEAGTGVSGARLAGMHLRLPGQGATGPTLEIFQYAEPLSAVEPAVNRPGLAHLAFAVAAVIDARAEVLARGGAPVGEVVTTPVGDDATVTWCYVRDPEGNIVELQSLHLKSPVRRDLVVTGDGV